MAIVTIVLIYCWYYRYYLMMKYLMTPLPTGVLLLIGICALMLVLLLLFIVDDIVIQL